MYSNRFFLVCAFSTHCFLLSAPAQNPDAPVKGDTFQFVDGDRVVLLGNTVLEREQRYAIFEPALALALENTAVQVRNLAWSGDTVFGDARSYFGPPAEGLERLRSHLEMIQPSVVILCYGSELAFAEGIDLSDFLAGYSKLVELIREKCPEARLVVLSPPPLENLAPPLPDLTQANANLASLRDALKKFAVKHDAFFIDWFEAMGGHPLPERTVIPLTENGVHYGAEGYQKLVNTLIAGFGLNVPSVRESDLHALQEAVRRKDELFFNRWRPQNETYLFGFRKREQGRNAKEVEQLDPLIQKADTEIQEVKRSALSVAPRL